MSLSDPGLSGQCLCGACRFTAQLGGGGASICHCGQCQRWTAGAFIAVDCSKGVTFDADAPLGHYQASSWGERVFCKECGSSLMWKMQDGSAQAVSIHAFDDPGQFDIKVELFSDCVPACYSVEGAEKSLTEAEVWALYGPPE